MKNARPQTSGTSAAQRYFNRIQGRLVDVLIVAMIAGESAFLALIFVGAGNA